MNRAQQIIAEVEAKNAPQWEAMSHAIDERESFRECCTPSHGDITDEARAVMKSCDDFIEKADKFCVKHFGQKSHSTQWREKMDAMPSVSIFKILGQENSDDRFTEREEMPETSRK